MVLIRGIPTQYTPYKGTEFNIVDYHYNGIDDINIIKKYIKSLIRGKKKQFIKIICYKEYINYFPDFDIDIYNDDIVLLYKYF